MDLMVYKSCIEIVSEMKGDSFIVDLATVVTIRGQNLPVLY